jgi:hypothetical protein
MVKGTFLAHDAVGKLFAATNLPLKRDEAQQNTLGQGRYDILADIFLDCWWQWLIHGLKKDGGLAKENQ